MSRYLGMSLCWDVDIGCVMGNESGMNLTMTNGDFPRLTIVHGRADCEMDCSCWWTSAKSCHIR